MSFITAPFKEDRGKRIIAESSSFRSWDYLKDTRPEAEKKVFPVGTSDGRASKFKVGFYRRPLTKIDPAAPRRAHEEVKETWAQNEARARQEKLQQVNEKNGNVLVPPPGEEKIFPSRRHFPSRAEAVAEQNHTRQKIGASRFHIEMNEKEKNFRDRQISNRLEAQKQTTSVIGYGREDLPTYGVVDTFSQYQYGEKDLLTRPKVKGPPPSSKAALIQKGSISLTDGSGFDFSRHHRPAAAGQQHTQQHHHQHHQHEQHHSQHHAAHPNQPKGLHTSVSTSSVPVAGARRANRSNQTSQGLSQAMSYSHLGSWSHHHNRIDSKLQSRPEASRMEPAGSNPVVPPPVFTQVTQHHPQP